MNLDRHLEKIPITHLIYQNIKMNYLILILGLFILTP